MSRGIVKAILLRMAVAAAICCGPLILPALSRDGEIVNGASGVIGLLDNPFRPVTDHEMRMTSV